MGGGGGDGRGGDETQLVLRLVEEPLARRVERGGGALDVEWVAIDGDVSRLLPAAAAERECARGHVDGIDLPDVIAPLGLMHRVQQALARAERRRVPPTRVEGTDHKAILGRAASLIPAEARREALVPEVAPSS